MCPSANSSQPGNWIWRIRWRVSSHPVGAAGGSPSTGSGGFCVGGLFSFWENSAWSLATRYVMSRRVFDRDAIMLTPPEARSLLCKGGFEILRTVFRFIFPRALRALRKIEDFVYRVPLDTQYQILSHKIL
jgi:hypothetical protein